MGLNKQKKKDNCGLVTLKTTYYEIYAIMALRFFNCLGASIEFSPALIKYCKLIRYLSENCSLQYKNVDFKYWLAIA